jgi:hypothetical protein
VWFEYKGSNVRRTVRTGRLRSESSQAIGTPLRGRDDSANVCFVVLDRTGGQLSFSTDDLAGVERHEHVLLAQVALGPLDPGPVKPSIGDSMRLDETMQCILRSLRDRARR